MKFDDEFDYLTVRVQNCLKAENMHSMREVADFVAKGGDLYRLPGIGKQGAAELYEAIRVWKPELNTESQSPDENEMLYRKYLAPLEPLGFPAWWEWYLTQTGLPEKNDETWRDKRLLVTGWMAAEQSMAEKRAMGEMQGRK